MGILSSLICVVAPLAAELTTDSVDVLHRVADEYQDDNRPTEIYLNPSLRHLWHDYSLTQVGSVANLRRDVSNSLVPELGNAESLLSIRASSFSLQSDKMAWGDALYCNGRIYDVLYNESSDFNRLRPYVVGDTIGGDISTRRYSISGGISKLYNGYRWGAEAAFNAKQEYRRIDPRPNNVSSDIYLSLSLMRELRQNQYLALALSLERYKQSGNIKIVSPLTKFTLYHYLGLGNDMTLFRGFSSEYNYKGYIFSPRIDFHSASFVASLIYNYSSYEKFAISPAVTYPLNELTVKSVSLYTAYNLSPIQRIRLNGAYSKYIGSEVVYGKLVNNIYPKIGESALYQRNSYNIDALYSLRHGAMLYEVGVAYISDVEEYIFPYAKNQISNGANVKFTMNGSLHRVHTHIIPSAHLSLESISNDDFRIGINPKIYVNHNLNASMGLSFSLNKHLYIADSSILSSNFSISLALLFF
ncbi:MAG: hypothetical protein Q4C30_09980 [Bacteroidia bacterium]|nr:hypothetical protein [Bacteroidia bacterium]